MFANGQGTEAPMGCPYYILDVFTQIPFAGNQLAAVRDCEHLSSAQMQAIAREFNFSETIFILPPVDPVNSARLRIFTPVAEIPFAGHPTIGGAILIAQMDAAEMLGQRELLIALELGAGLVTCEVRKVKDRTIRAVFDAPVLPRLLAAPEVAVAAAALGLTPEEIGFDAHRPSVYSAGTAFAFVPVRSREAVSRSRPVPERWDRLVGPQQCIGAFVYCKNDRDEAAHVHARMFAPHYGVPEDAATGSAAAAFGGVCLDSEKPGDGEHQVIIEQGVEMGRPSEIVLTITVRGGALERVSVGGSAVVVASGTLNIRV